MPAWLIGVFGEDILWLYIPLWFQVGIGQLDKVKVLT